MRKILIHLPLVGRLLAAVIIPCVAAAQASLPVAATRRIHQLGTAFVRENPHVGLAIGVVYRGQTTSYPFGQATLASAAPPTARTRFELASFSKTFASLLLAKAVVAGKISLTADIRRYLPGQYPNLAYQGRPIRVVDLVTLTSGLPDNVPELALAPGMPPDSLAFHWARALPTYSPAQFYAYLHTVRLSRPPGQEPGHSNVAAQLVGYLLEQVYHQPYAVLLRRGIEQPLGMRSGLAPATAAQPVAVGYNAQRQRMPRMVGPTFQPVVSLAYSSNDLLRYVAYQVAEADPAVRLTHRPGWGTLATQAIGFNWSLNRTVEGQRALHTSGSSFGYASYCDLYPAARLGVVVQVNQTGPDLEGRLQQLAQQVAEAIQGPSRALQALQAGLTAAHYRQPARVLATVRRRYPSLHLTEDYLNQWGGGLMFQGKRAEAAGIFQLAVALFPTSWNAHDSLGWAYAELGQRPQAIASYERSVQLNPHNTEGIEQLTKLRQNEPATH